MFRNLPQAARPMPRLLYQLLPAVFVTAVGALLLSNLAKTPNTTSVAAPVDTAITAEAVFKITPREVEAEPSEVKPAKAAAARGPVKTGGTNHVAQSRKAATEPVAMRQAASAPAPLSIVPVAEQPLPVAAATPEEENTVASRLRNATTTVQRIPQWAARSVAGWFSESAPPRPPAEVPAQNFQAAM